MADPPSCWLTRFLFLRLLGLVYTVAFLVILFQWEPLLGSRGLLPARDFLDAVGAQQGRGFWTFLRVPTLFWLDPSDAAFRTAGIAGLCLSLAVVLGLANPERQRGEATRLRSAAEAGGNHLVPLAPD